MDEIGGFEDSIGGDFQKREVIFNHQSVEEDDGYMEASSNRQRLIVEDDDLFKNLAATMRNPNVNKLNILDTIAAEVRVFNSKR
jgi:hypothetical protein